MKPSQAAFDLIIQGETRGSLPPFRVFRDELGRPAIGFGHVITPQERMPERVSRELAFHLLDQDLKYCSSVLDSFGTPLHQPKVDALTCWLYYALQGRSSTSPPEIVQGSALVERLRQGKLQLAGAELAKWVYAGDRLWRPFVHLRAREQAIYFQG